MKTCRLSGGYRDERRKVIYVPGRHCGGSQSDGRYEAQPRAPAVCRLDDCCADMKGTQRFTGSHVSSRICYVDWTKFY